MRYDRKYHRVYLCMAHMVFCPKYRRPVLIGKIANRLKEICYEVAAEKKWKIHEIAINPDHVHLFVEFSVDYSPHKIVKAFKGRTSNLLRKEFPELITRIPTLWTRSYFFCTCGNVSQETIKKYIEAQKNV